MSGRNKMTILSFRSKINRDAMFNTMKHSGMKNIRKTMVFNIKKTDLQIVDNPPHMAGYRLDKTPKLHHRIYNIEDK